MSPSLPNTPRLHAALAGLLAEFGVGDLTLARPGGPETPLAPRATDLPALLAGATVGTRLASAGRGLVMVLAPSGWGYSTSDTDLAAGVAALHDPRDRGTRS